MVSPVEEPLGRIDKPWEIWNYASKEWKSKIPQRPREIGAVATETTLKRCFPAFDLCEVSHTNLMVRRTKIFYGW